MSIFTHSMLFILWLVVLVLGADFLVDSSVRIAKKLGVSELIIGLTLVAGGTVAPEFASGISAAIRGYTDLVIGTIIGSNIANICLIIGISALFITLKVKEKVLTRDGYILLFATILFYIFALNNSIGRLEGIIFIAFYLAYVTFLLLAKIKGEQEFRTFLIYFFKLRYLITIKNRLIREFTQKQDFKKIKKGKKDISSEKVYALFKEALIKDFLLFSFGCAAVILGANYVVVESGWFTEYFNISGSFIGLTVLAIGTSLPELSVAISALRKNFGDILLGNIIGSNITNIFLILGITSIITPLNIIENAKVYTIPFLIVTTLLLLVFIKSDWKVTQRNGIALILMYIAFLSLILFTYF